MKNYLRYSLILATLLLLGCEREICKDLEIVETTATLVWSGDYAVDGCGYMIKIGEQGYKPENEEDINETFQAYEPTPVHIKYIPQGKKEIQCGMLPVKHSVDFIRVISIKKI